VEALFQQFADTEYKVQDGWVAENVFLRLLERHFIHKVPPFGRKSTPQRRCVV
jgi:hypothetical protein